MRVRWMLLNIVLADRNVKSPRSSKARESFREFREESVSKTVPRRNTIIGSKNLERSRVNFVSSSFFQTLAISSLDSLIKGKSMNGVSKKFDKENQRPMATMQSDDENTADMQQEE